MVEAVRYGARKGGDNIGCCAITLFQGFSYGPDEENITTVYHGDSRGELGQIGRTNKEVFEAYLKIGTYDFDERQDHIFFAVLSDEQARSKEGKAWLSILKENHFKFFCTNHNSVYNNFNTHPVHVFVLVRNISSARVVDPFAPPAFWTELEEPTTSVEEVFAALQINYVEKEKKAPVNNPFLVPLKK